MAVHPSYRLTRATLPFANPDPEPDDDSLRNAPDSRYSYQRYCAWQVTFQGLKALNCLQCLNSGSPILFCLYKSHICCSTHLSLNNALGGNMRQLSPDPRARRKFRFRAFYITVLCICFFSIASFAADSFARYQHGVQYGVAQRQALEELDVRRLVKRDEEVRQMFTSPLSSFGGTRRAVLSRMNC